MSSDENVWCLPVEAVQIESVLPLINRYSPATPNLLRELLEYKLCVPRSKCETDELLVQVIPYMAVVLGDFVLTYRREGGGEARLNLRESLGFGGHLNDGDASYLEGLFREGREELQGFSPHAVSVPIGFILDKSNAVGRVHVGVLHLYDFEAAPVVPVEAKDYRWSRIDHAYMSESMETWSRLAAAMLLQIGESGEGVSDDSANVDG